MPSHQLRVILVTALTALFAIADVVCLVLEVDARAAAALTGALAVLLPATLDALKVEQRRRTPGMRAVADDLDGPSKS